MKITTLNTPTTPPTNEIIKQNQTKQNISNNDCETIKKKLELQLSFDLAPATSKSHFLSVTINLTRSTSQMYVPSYHFF